MIARSYCDETLPKPMERTIGYIKMEVYSQNRKLWPNNSNAFEEIIIVSLQISHHHNLSLYDLIQLFFSIILDNQHHNFPHFYQ